MTIIPFILFIIIFLGYPFISLFLGSIYSSSEVVQLFTPSVITLISVILLLLYPEKVYKKLSASPFLFLLLTILSFIAFAQFFTFELLPLSFLLNALLYLTFPLICYIYSKQILTYLPYFLSLLWCVNAIHSLIQFYLKLELIGLPGNRNWHATLLIITTPFLLYLLSRAMRKYPQKKLLFKILIGLISIFSLISLYFCYSRGANLALICTLATIGLFSLKKQKIKIGLTTILIILFGIGTLFYFKRDAIQQAINDDIRLPVWRETITLVQNHPFGVNGGRFETVFARYRPVDYFFKKVSTVRTNHPHNHFLYIASAFGVIGFIIWGILLFYPLLTSLTLLNKTRYWVTSEKLVLFAFIVCLVHGFFDLVLFSWPTNYLFLMFLGIIWRKLWHTKTLKKVSIPIQSPFFLFLRYATLISLISFTVYYTIDSFRSYLSLRQSVELANNKHYFESLYFANDSIDRHINRTNIYKATTLSFFKLNNPDLSLHYAQLFPTISIENYAHNQGILGLSYIRKGDLRNGIIHLKQEVANYPIYVSGLYNLYVAQRQMHHIAAAKQTYTKLVNILMLKGMTMKALPFLLKNPKYDEHPSRIPKNLRKPEYFLRNVKKNDFLLK